MDEESISIKLTYYNKLCEEFSNNVIIFCSGILVVTESPGSYPELSIRFHFFIRFM